MRRFPSAISRAPRRRSYRLVRRVVPTLLVTFAAAVAAGCPRNRAAEEAQARARAEAERALLRQSRITVLRSGGIAGQETEATVDGTELTYAIVTGPLCGSGLACPPPTEASSGKIDAELARELFAKVDAEQMFDMRDDYGTSPTLRDGFDYVVTLRRGERTKRVRGDDATQPPGLARVVAAVFEAVDRARGRPR